MTRKDYVIIAAALAEARPTFTQDCNEVQRATENQWLDCCRTISVALAADNPAFNNVIFVRACLAGV